MKIISYNVNGIRAAMKKDFITWLKAANPDVLCLQEIKATEDQVDKDAFSEAGYEYQYYFSAQKKGYSGVAILCKTQPDHVEYGTGIEYMDNEGRNLRVDYGDLSIMSMYLPSGTNDARLSFKFQYMDDFLAYTEELRRERPQLLICGDYNICHKAIDIHDPVRLKNTSGFLPEERAWMDQFVESGFIDTFRMFNDQPDEYSWWSYRGGSRARNKGWRLDYHMVTTPLESSVKRAVILQEAVHSDHCPVLVELE
ncbi:exodeoxyribonuclease III [Nonlabens sp. MIC269]|uniref:exodeoxyribonuclease III n=1 Tax=Nonlabens TaxID=363408 RepID=UPI000720E9E1|nr:exodeoxyribonuclease III [Nonlabens sp. MIC269]ALM21186.1 exodeoxyribonuclease III [Nonlabens sp. MIC269]MEE2801585.1 exodeoxyribonuclease III [Bacteroidota bacterium]